MVKRLSIGVLKALSRVQIPEFEPLDLDDVMDDIEGGLIRNALISAGYRKRVAAELLGITPRSLRYRERKLMDRGKL